jgi:hypothetical protein
MDTWRTDFAAHPSFHHLTPWLDRIGGPTWPELSTLNKFAVAENLRNAQALPVQFVTQSGRCSQHEYEIGIYGTGQVPSRERNWHDLFNALTWLAFPATKAALNAVHHAVLPQGKNRTPASDAATLFDESGLVLVGEDASLANLLTARRWQEALVLRRNEWKTVQAYVIGHAILEKLLTPWPGITAKCLFVNQPPDTPLTALDEIIAKQWQAGSVTASITAPAALFPMPVLGIPNWWPANETADFYANAQIFRPLRSLTATK